MKKFLNLLAVCLLATVALQAQNRRFEMHAIGFYNLENLFDTCHDEGKNDYQYLPDGTNRWTALKYSHKLKNMSRVLSEMGTDVVPNGCVAIGVSEVENARCLTDLCNQESLKKRNFSFVHVEGPDQRGVDCALLYNPKLFTVRDVKLVPYYYEYSSDAAGRRPTRGFLSVSGTLSGEHVTIIVNHLPSRASSSYYREWGGKLLHALKDSLMNDDPNVKILIMGDMNDDPQDKSMAVELGAKRYVKEMADDPKGLWNPWWDVLASGTGTLQYQGAWNLFDQIILSRSLLDPKAFKGNKLELKKLDCLTLKYYKHQVFRRDYLFQKEGKYKGNTLRTFAGGVWLDGYSDHLPSVVYLIKEQR